MTRNYTRLWIHTDRKSKTHKTKETQLEINSNRTNLKHKLETLVDTKTKEISNKLQTLETATKQTQTINVDAHCKCHNNREGEHMVKYNTLIRQQNEIKNLETRTTYLERILLVKQQSSTPTIWKPEAKNEKEMRNLGYPEK